MLAATTEIRVGVGAVPCDRRPPGGVAEQVLAASLPLERLVLVVGSGGSASVEVVRQAKKQGINVTAEASPHHLMLTDERLSSYESKYKMNPPLRTQEDVDAVVKGVVDGTIDAIASDHAPHTVEEKEQELAACPNGVVGLETALGVVLSLWGIGRRRCRREQERLRQTILQLRRKEQDVMVRVEVCHHLALLPG